MSKLKEFLSSSWGNLILSAFVGAIVSFATTTYFDNKNRQITLMPYLTTGFLAKKMSDDLEYKGIIISNIGKGPAIIESISFHINNKVINVDENILTNILSNMGINQYCRVFIDTDGLLERGDALEENSPKLLLGILREGSEDNLQKIYRRATASNVATVEEIEKLRLGHSQCKHDFENFFKDKKKSFILDISYKSINGDSYHFGNADRKQGRISIVQ